MPEFSITVTGLEDVQQMLRDAPRDIVALGYLRALTAAGNVIAGEVGMRTPIKSEDTGGLLAEGELRELLIVDVQLDSQFRGGVTEVGFGKKGGAVANFVEYGHLMVGHKPGKEKLGDVPAHPFMRPAADASAEAAIDAFARSLEETVRSNFPQGRAA